MTSMTPAGPTTRIALIGLGEVGRVFAEDFAGLGLTDLVAWDIGFTDPQSSAGRNASDLGLACADSAEAAAEGADLVISAVTAANVVVAASSVSAGIEPQAWYFDLNSSSPGHKQQAALIIDEVGGRYVEAALMSPIAPRRLGSPFLLGGPHCREFGEAAPAWGFTDITEFSAVVGKAAATKLCRSVIVKGLESLLTESMLAARTHGVETEVLNSLSNILPPADWEKVASYFISRSLQHGNRRSEEMYEAAATVFEAGVEPLMSVATAQRQAWAARHADALSEPDIFAMLDHMLRSEAAAHVSVTRTELVQEAP